MSAQLASAALQKSLGAFYTHESIADRLVSWAVTDRSQSVLDPSCGDGVFLSAADMRLRVLSCESPRIHGVDTSYDALKLAHERVESAKLIHSDFFKLNPSSLPSFDCVVGNPPFIRYQTFNGDKDSLGHRRAKEAGVNLPRLASSWAPFLVHASRFLRQGGRLAMVIPSELGHAMYAREVLRFLVENFRHVAVEMFRDKLFEDLSQSTVLLFCEGYGESCRSFIIASSDDIGKNDRRSTRVDVARVKGGRFRFTHYLVSEKVRDLYEALAANEGVELLGEAADVGIGYVTGANRFFHLSMDECRHWDIAKRFLRPCLLNLRDFLGLEYTHESWKARRNAGDKVYLLALPPVAAERLPANIRAYLDYGEKHEFAKPYKCRIREFWYSVPHVRIADAFLSYMSGEQPLLVTNAANLVAPNTVHVLRFSKTSNPLYYAISWRSSLTKLSCELEGHALGGGLFKLEPSEAESVLIARPRTALLKQITGRFDSRAQIHPEKTADLVDQFLLRKYLGLSQAECVLLREAAVKLESWRKHK